MEVLLNFKDYFKQIKRNLILNNYYSKKIKDGKNLRASILDWIFINLILAVFFIITTFNTTKNIVLSIVLTFILIFIYLFISITLTKRKRIKKIAKINEDLSDEEVLKRFEKLNSEEYLLYIKELLEKYYKTKLYNGNEYIDFIGEINGEYYGIKCFKSSLENIITKKDIENYHHSIKISELENGIIITNSYFHEDLKEQFDYILIDFNYIKEIFKKLGEYPTTEEIHKSILSNYRDKKTALREDFNNNKREKVYKFGLLGIILYLIAPYTSYSLYYKISGTILIIVGIVLGINKLLIFLKTNAKNKI